MIRMRFIALAAVFAAGAATAGCDDVDVADAFLLDVEDIEALYTCLEARMAAEYAQNGDPVAIAYRDWTPTSTRPAAAGPHGSRILFSFANDIAAEQYLKYEEDGVVMPVGSIIAKESISIEAGKARAGPLFIMTKMPDGTIPDTSDWLYTGVRPDGSEMAVSQSFCHDCHILWESSDMLAYPLEDVRVKATN